MANFETTLTALVDCKEAMGETSDLSPEDARYRRNLIRVCVEIAAQYKCELQRRDAGAGR